MSGKSTYNREIGIEICTELMSTEKSFNTICMELGIVPRTAWRWVADNDDFKELYAMAKAQQMHFMGEQTIVIADKPSKNLVEATDKKNQIQARQFLMGKYNQKVFGDNRNVVAEIKSPQPMSADQFNLFIETLKTRPKQIQQETTDIDHEEIT